MASDPHRDDDDADGRGGTALPTIVSSQRVPAGSATSRADHSARPRVAFIAGSSFSGSTLLGLILGTDAKAIFVGEPNQLIRPLHVDPRTGRDRRVCTCGESLETCGFWSSVRARHGSDLNLNPAPGFSLANLRLMLRIVSPLRRPRQRPARPYRSLLEAVSAAARTEKPGVELVVDASKSIHSLEDLARSPDIDVVIVHLLRDCAAVADSYKARGSSPLYGIAAWGLGNMFLRLYAWRRRMRVLAVDYEALCLSPGRELARLNGFLGLSLAADRVTQGIRREPYHLFSGNPRVREKIREFAGIEHRGHGAHLGRFERLAAIGMRNIVRGLLRVPDLTGARRRRVSLRRPFRQRSE